MQGGGRGQQCTVLIMNLCVCVCVCVCVCLCLWVCEDHCVALWKKQRARRRRLLRSSSEARVHHPIFTALTPGADPAGYERSPARTNEDAINCSSALLRLLGSLLLKTHFISRHTVHKATAHCLLVVLLLPPGAFFFLCSHALHDASPPLLPRIPHTIQAGRRTHTGTRTCRRHAHTR
jgi:hypothetical protein